MNQFCVCPRKRQHKSLLGGGVFLPPISGDKKKKRRENQRQQRGVELLCNYNMVLKSKYQTLATSARRQREKGGTAERRGGKKIGKGS